MDYLEQEMEQLYQCKTGFYINKQKYLSQIQQSLLQNLMVILTIFQRKCGFVSANASW